MAYYKNCYKKKLRALHRYCSELGYFDHKQLEHKHSVLEKEHEKVKETAEVFEKNNKKICDEIENAKKEIIALQKTIQQMQVTLHFKCFTMLYSFIGKILYK